MRGGGGRAAAAAQRRQGGGVGKGRRQGRREGEGEEDRGGDKVGGGLLGRWAALMGLFFLTLRLSGPLFFSFRGIYDVYKNVYVHIWYRLASRLETPRLD